VGAGAAAAIDFFSWWKTLLALLVSLALQVGVNYANDYSDGIRGTDEVRVGPMRLVGSGAAKPSQVKQAAFGCFALAGIAGLVLAAVTTWWLLPFGIAAVAAAWFYTGGPKPYGYAGYGEIFVFVFFGLMAVLGTCYVNSQRITFTAVVAAIGIGLLACALLMVNNLRDVATDGLSGKRTLAVLLGDRLARLVLVLTIAGAYLAVLVISIRHPWCLLALVSAPLAVPPIRQVLRGDKGPSLIRTLGAIGRLEFVYAVLLTAGLVLEH
jgi:1,4-dihydroxy-2-naphthoate octaprenyltransferase